MLPIHRQLHLMTAAVNSEMVLIGEALWRIYSHNTPRRPTLRSAQWNTVCSASVNVMAVLKVYSVLLSSKKSQNLVICRSIKY